MAEQTGEATQEVTEAPSAESGQPEQVSTDEQPTALDPKDVVTRDDFKKMQSILDRQVAQGKEENKLLRQQLKEYELNAAPEEQREVLKWQQQAEDLRQEVTRLQKENALNQLSRETGVPYETLMQAQTPEEAWGMVAQQQAQRIAELEAMVGGQAPQVAPTTPQQQQQSPPAQTPFVTPQQPGGGSKARDWDAELKEAQKTGRPDLYIRLLREMGAEGS